METGTTAPQPSRWKRFLKWIGWVKEPELEAEKLGLMIVPELDHSKWSGMFENSSNLTELPREYNKRLKSAFNALFSKGYAEGLSGSRTPLQEIHVIAQTKVEHVQTEVKTYAKRLYNMANSKLKSLKFTQKATGILLGQQASYHHELIRQSQLHSRDYSISLMILYLVCAILLILADIPLALELTKDGFSLEQTEEESLQLVKLFDPFSQKSGWSQFFDVLKANWEVAFMAMGVAFFTVFIKIFWDEFVGSPVQNVVRQYHQLPGDYNLAELEEIKQNGRRRFGIKLAVLGLTLGTILVLGFFRVSTKIGDFEERQMLAEKAGIEIPASEQWSYLDGAAFILITLMFPVIGGICLSKGLHILHNRSQLKSSRKNHEKTQRKYQHFLLNELTNAKAKKKELKVLVEKCESPDFTTQYSIVLLEAYRLGLEHGSQKSLEGAQGDSFLRAKVFRDQLSNQRIQRSLRSTEQLPLLTDSLPPNSLPNL